MSHIAAKTILIADDDPSHLLLAEASLAGAGFLVHTAADGEEAVQQYGVVKPDCVILDVNMPKLTGIEACRQIRVLTGGSSLPILMLTGRNDLPSISDAYAAGASDFAQKGMNPRLLVERVRFLLRDRALQEELRSSRSKLLLAQRIARVGHWELGLDGNTLHVSPMLGELLGLPIERLGRYEEFIALLDPAEQYLVRTAFVTCASGNGRFSFDHSVQTAAGATICVHQEAELVHGGGGPESNVVIVTLQDLTRLRHAEESVRLLSYFDTATGLQNRRQLAEQVALALTEKAGTAATAVVTFRVHNFDRIVQTQGSGPASELIVQLAHYTEAELERIGQVGTIVWRSSPPSVCRSADGELAFLLRSRVSAEHIATVTHGVLEEVCAKALQLEVEYVPAISAGVAIAERDSITAEQLVINSHAAAELAVDPRSCAFFSPLPQARARRRLLMESALRCAVERRELHLVYQPRVAIDTFELTGIECLVRWDNPQFGKIRAEEFIPIAEETGIIDEIGRWVIEDSCRQLAAWRDRYAKRFFASISLSARQLRNPNLGTMIKGAIDRYRLPPDSLQVEVREAGIIDASDATFAVLTGLQSSGVRIGIDEFGTGHSSLGQMRRVPFDSMKLDPALMVDLYTDPWTQGVTAAVLAMARAMRIRSVAGGVEDVEVLTMLQALGCEEIQGQCVAPPLKARDFEDWMARGGASHLARQFSLENLDDTASSRDDDASATIDIAHTPRRVDRSDVSATIDVSDTSATIDEALQAEHTNPRRHSR
jgi:EAL domain-containing protein (putative c-di-GMP-specific phosphodiesterase class I)/DNA-binding response OmpR family regulator/GGDEF domain-containing protein